MALQTQKIIDLSSMPEEPSVDDTGKGISILATVDANATGIGAAMHCAADGHWEEADASADTTAPCTGLALSSGTGASKEILQQGQVRNDGWTWVTGPGEKGLIYLSITTGALTQTAPTGDGEIVQIVGHAITDDVMMFNPQLQWIELGSGLSILLADGSVPLTEDWDVLDNKITAQNLAADALTAGRVIFTGTDGLLSVDSAFVWDNTNKRLGIGVTPTVSLDIAGGTIRVVSNGDKISLYENDVAEADGFFKVINGSSAANVFLPVFFSKGNITGGTYVNGFVLDSDSDDIGDALGACGYFSARTSNGVVTNRRLFEFNNFTTNVMTLLANGNVGIGTAAPLAQLHVDQSSTSGAIPVLTLDQADVSEGFINLIGTSAASAVGPISTWTSGGAALEGYYRVEINGVQKWAPYHGDPTS